MEEEKMCAAEQEEDECTYCSSRRDCRFLHEKPYCMRDEVVSAKSVVNSLDLVTLKFRLKQANEVACSPAISEVIKEIEKLIELSRK